MGTACASHEYRMRALCTIDWGSFQYLMAELDVVCRSSLLAAYGYSMASCCYDVGAGSAQHLYHEQAMSVLTPWYELCAENMNTPGSARARGVVRSIRPIYVAGVIRVLGNITTVGTEIPVRKGFAWKGSWWVADARIGEQAGQQTDRPSDRRRQHTCRP